MLIASATIAKSRWSLIELGDKDDHGEAEKDGDEKDLREEGRRLAKDQNHGKGHGNNHGKDHGKNHGNHGKKVEKAGAGDDDAIFGGLNRAFRSRFLQW